MIVEAVRLLITLALTAAGFEMGGVVERRMAGGASELARVEGALLGAAFGYVLGGVLGRSIRSGLDVAPEVLGPRWSGSELFAAAFGVVAGMAVGAVLAIPVIVFLPAAVGWPVGALVVFLLSAFAGRIFAARSEDLLLVAGLRPRAPLMSKRLGSNSAAYLLDSSAAIDGRVLELARSGLLKGQVWVPAFVVDELQAVADAADRSRRRRGRRGLDVVDALRDVDGVELAVLEDSVPEQPEVDAKLVTLAAQADAIMITTDHNLAKAAGIRGVGVLNPHALGESLRPALVTGERMVVAVSRTGSEPGQGVGYLDDGTMVVVEEGAELVGGEVEVEVTSSLRTSVGRMVFGRPVA
ncbi:MAG: TRAM domain-containing protein [Actinomycetota bacterium]|nr:TRAM domain-containing protein [Actinomycetota bacterium]